MRWITRVEEAFRKPASRWRRFFKEIVVDLILIAVSLWFSYAVSWNEVFPPEVQDYFFVEAVVLSLVAIVLLLWRGLYSINVRYIGLGDFLNIALVGVVLMVGLFSMQRFTSRATAHFVLEPIMFGFFMVSLLAGVRVAQRLHSWRTLPSESRDGLSPKRTLIVGAGDAGEMIMREIARSRHPMHQVVGFVDDDPEKLNLRIHGVPVRGNVSRIPFLVKDLIVEELLIALPSAKGEEMRRIINTCQQTGARVRTLPAMNSLLTSGPQLTLQFREVEIEDLLRREAVATDLAGISDYLSGERVMITGGGGSIGSELARQIAGFSPADLILLGKGENSIYEIEQELLHTKGFQTTSVIADVRDSQCMDLAFARTTPTVVFHAAAHKHVPLMQANPIEAIRNNVGGTWRTAELAMRHGARRFIYVSTDKAVKPSSIMGATKRVGEMIVSAFGQRSETEFSIVRFGNVMGSRGSLIPMLKAQIKRGGPVRVTHPEMTRYFMTIPEAVQLILQAGTFGKGGEIFLLDMGQPIRILDLATDLIRLHGLVPGEDIQIQFTGVRPGEKIHEELLYEQEMLGESSHPKISVVRSGNHVDWDWLKAELDILFQLCDDGKSDDAKNLLMELAWGKTAGAGFPMPTHAVHETSPANLG